MRMRQIFIGVFLKTSFLSVPPPFESSLIITLQFFLSRNTLIVFYSQFCYITPHQAVMRKLDEKQTAVMVRNAATGTDIRRERIMSTVRKSIE